MEATLYTDEESFDGFVLRWLAIEKECPITIEVLPPWHRVPVKLPYFQDRELALFDHYVIVQYLQERYPGEELMPSDPQLRGQIRQICTLIREANEDIVDDLKHMLFGNHYLVGQRFSLADVYAGAWLRQLGARRASLPVRVYDYLEQLESRPAYREALP